MNFFNHSNINKHSLTRAKVQDRDRTFYLIKGDNSRIDIQDRDAACFDGKHAPILIETTSNSPATGLYGTYMLSTWRRQRRRGNSTWSERRVMA